MSKSILIASGKGGTGKSMFAANIGTILAQKGHKVCLLDLNMGLRCIDLYLGQENEVVYDLGDVLSGRCGIKQALIKSEDNEKLSFIAASPEPSLDEITPLHMEVLAQKLKENFDYIIIDAPSGVDYGLQIAIGGADECIIVSTPEYAAVRDAEVLVKELKRFGIENVRLLLNMVRQELMEHDFVPSVDIITRQMRLELLGLVPYDENIHISTNVGVPIVCKKGTYIEENFRAIGERI